MSDQPSLIEQVRQRRKELGLVKPTETDVQEWDEDLLSPPSDTKNPNRDPIDDAIDDAVDNLGIDDAYRRWVPKPPPVVGNKRESILVSCPNPAHADANPSAWLNLDKNVGVCAVCGGFDNFDIYAWNHGLTVPGYRTDGSFVTVKKDIGAELGFVSTKTIGGQTIVTKVGEPDEEEDEELATVTEMPQEIDEYGAALDGVPPIDWRSILGDESTFLYEWMLATSGDDLPEEFYFWLGMLAVGLAAGNDCKIATNHAVRGNLMVCLVGNSGSGKSRSVNTFAYLLREALPADGEKGVHPLNAPGSAEALIDQFVQPIIDIGTGAVTGYEPVRGILKINELADMVGKANRQGNTIKPTMMDFYDTDGPVTTRSRGHGSVKATDHFCSVVSTTQGKMIRRLLSEGDSDSGFLNRWVFATGIPKEPDAWEAARIDIDSLVPLLRGIRAWADRGRSVTIDASALAVWRQFFKDALVPLKSDEDATMFGRIDLLFKKIMLLFAIDQHKTVIDAEIVGSAIKLWPYLKAIYGAVDTQVGRSDEMEVASRIKACIRRKGKGGSISHREMMRSIGQKNSRFPRKLILDTIKNMILMGEITEEVGTPGRGGQRTVTYRMAK